MQVKKYSSEDVTQWWQRGDQHLYLGGILDNTSDAKMSVGFIRYCHRTLKCGHEGTAENRPRR